MLTQSKRPPIVGAMRKNKFSSVDVCIGLGGVAIKAMLNVKQIVLNDTNKNKTVYR